MGAILNASTGAGTISIGGTRYTSVGDSSSGAFSATEANFQQTWRTAGTASNLYVRIIANTVTATSTYRTRKTTANGGQSVSIASSTTGEFTDGSGSDTLAAGDLFNYQMVIGGTGTNIQHTVIATQFAATSNTSKRFCSLSSTGATLNTASTTFYHDLSSVVRSANTTESVVQYTFKNAGTCKNGFVRILTNARTNTSTVNFRKNTANGNMAISIGSATTGIFEDTSNTDSVAVNDICNWATTLGTTNNNLVPNIFACDFETTDLSSQYFTASPGVVQSSGVTNFQSIQGAEKATTTESDAQIKTGLTGTYSNLEINVTTSTSTPASTLTFRSAGADGNQAVSITALTTGVFTDAVNTDAPASSAEINTKLLTSAVGSLTWQYIGMKFISPAVGGAVQQMLTLMGMGS